jgi:hypothetical protein
MSERPPAITAPPIDDEVAAFYMARIAETLSRPTESRTHAAQERMAERELQRRNKLKETNR